MPVNVMAGWIASGTMSLPAADSNTEMPCAPGRVHDELAGREGAGRAQPRDEVGEGVVGHGEHHEVGAGDDLGDRLDGHARQQGGRPLEARLADGGDAGDDVAGAGQGRSEDGSDAPGAHDADVEARGTLVRGAHPRHAIAYSPEAWIPFPGATRGTRRCMPPGAVSTSRAAGPPPTSRRPRTGRPGACSPRRCSHCGSAEHDHAARVVVDVGAGRGELATHLPSPRRPRTLRVEVCRRAASPSPRALRTQACRRAGRDGPSTGVVAVDVVERPEGLDERVDVAALPRRRGPAARADRPARRPRHRARVARRRAVHRGRGRRRRHRPRGPRRPRDGRGVPRRRARRRGPSLGRRPTGPPPRRATASRSVSPVTRPGPTSSRASARARSSPWTTATRRRASVRGDAHGIRRAVQLTPPVPDGSMRPHGARRDGHPRRGRRARPSARRCGPSG